MVPFNMSKRAVVPSDLAIASGISQRAQLGCRDVALNIYRPSTGLGSLGFRLPGAVSDVMQSGATGSMLDAAQTGVSFVPGVGPAASQAMAFLRDAITAFENWFNIGAGRNEADVIVPKQNELMDRLGFITNQILVGSCPDLNRLLDLYLEVWQLALGFMEFVLLQQFEDRRASGQALNTIMPYIDGTCDYAVPIGLSAFPGRRNCITWGDGTCGGPGTDGMLGALGRAIENAGGEVPVLGMMTEQASQGTNPEDVHIPIGLRVRPLLSGIGAPGLLLGAVVLVGLANRKKFFGGA